MSFARWRHFVTACGSDWGYQQAVLSLEQGFGNLVVVVVVGRYLLFYHKQILEYE